MDAFSPLRVSREPDERLEARLMAMEDEHSRVLDRIAYVIATTVPVPVPAPLTSELPDGASGEALRFNASTSAWESTDDSAIWLPLAGGTLTGLVYLWSRTTTERDALTPTAGALLWNSTTKTLNRYNGTHWVEDESAVNRPVQIVAATNNYALGTGRTQFLNTDASRTITGFVATYDGDRRAIVNNGAFDLVIANQDVGSSAANRVITGTGGSIVMIPDDTIAMVYDGTSQKWRLL